MLLALLIAGCATTPSAESASGARYAGRSDLGVTVVDPDGSPVPDAWVTLTPSGRDAGTDDQGRATFIAVEAESYRVVADGPGLERGEALARPGVATVSVVVTPVDATTGALVGQLTDAAGAPLAGVPISLDGSRTAKTDGSGAYAFAAIAPGVHTVAVEPEAGIAAPWSSDRVAVRGGSTLTLDVSLAGTAPLGAQPVGSARCAECHPEAADHWEQTAHAAARRTPGDLEAAGHPLAADFLSTTEIELDGALGRARLHTPGGTWAVDVESPGGAVLGTWAVEAVYGAHDAGAVLIGRQGFDPYVVLPLTWGPEGPAPAQARGFGPAWTDRWTSTGPDPVLASFDLACAGCHVTGGQLQEDAGSWAFVDAGPSPREPFVGCEACHGDGSAHAADQRPTSIVHPGRLDGVRQTELCARCHGQYEPGDHPFSAAPGWPTTGDGRMVPPDRLREHAAPARDPFVAVAASRVRADQSGELLASPHHQGALGYQGACGDCHLAHGSSHPADLRVDPLDDRLCTDCHRDRRTRTAQREHAGHTRFAPGAWSPGGCVGCHLPRVADVGRHDPLSGVGDLHAHTLDVWHPDAVLAEFDASATDTLAPGQVPVPGCLDCHTQAQYLMNDAGLSFPGPFGDPYQRVTYENLGRLFDRLWSTP